MSSLFNGNWHNIHSCTRNNLPAFMMWVCLWRFEFRKKHRKALEAFTVGSKLIIIIKIIIIIIIMDFKHKNIVTLFFYLVYLSV